MENRPISLEPTPCEAGINCGHAIDPEAENIKYVVSEISCRLPELLVASPSKFHDQTLIDATTKINQTMAEIPADKDGRRASLLVNNLGIMLAWVHHDNRPAGNYCVSPNDDNETLTKALKLVV